MSQNAKENDKQKIYTPEGRVSFPYIFEKNDYSDKPKYELTLLFPPGTDLSALKVAAREAARKKWGKDVPKRLRSPFRDAGEKEGIDGYEPGWIFVAFRSTRKPGVVDIRSNPIFEEDEFYPGCWARLTCNVYAYDRQGNKGVAFGLQNIQKTKDDDSFAGGSTAEEDFGAPGGSDDPGAYGGSDDIFGDEAAHPDQDTLF